MRVVTIIQARLSSSRLPGKVLLPLLGEPMLQRVVERVRRASGTDVLVATSDDPSDDELATWCAEHGIECYRGPLHDVLGRYREAAEASNADVVVRITADCPFAEATVIEEVVHRLVAEKAEYVGNTRERSYPHGADVEAFTIQALRVASDEATEPFEREHVTPFIWSRPDRFKQCQVLAPDHLRRPDLRITVDTVEDYMFVTALYEELDNGYASLHDVLSILKKKPWLTMINSSVRQKPVFADRDPATRMARELTEGARILLRQDMYSASMALSRLAVTLTSAEPTSLTIGARETAEQVLGEAENAIAVRQEAHGV